MTRVDFYHLTRDPAPQALARIAAKVLESGERLLVVADDAALRERIADALWAAPGFLANGAANDADAVRQPVLLTESADAAPNGAKMVALADGVWREAALDFERTLYFFGADNIADARAAWRKLGEREDCQRHYWKQDGPRWVEGP